MCNNWWRHICACMPICDTNTNRHTHIRTHLAEPHKSKNCADTNNAMFNLTRNYAQHLAYTIFISIRFLVLFRLLLGCRCRRCCCFFPFTFAIFISFSCDYPNGEYSCNTCDRYSFCFAHYYYKHTHRVLFATPYTNDSQRSYSRLLMCVRVWVLMRIQIYCI